MARLTAIGLSVAVCCLVVVSTALGFARLEGEPVWPGSDPHITYYVAAKAYSGPTQMAVAAWNRAGARFQLQRVRAERDADIVIVADRPHFLSHGYCPLGGHTVTESWSGSIARSTVHLEGVEAGGPSVRECRFELTRVAAHEIGHAIGLGHEPSKCALMNPMTLNRSPEHCPASSRDNWRCRLIERDDSRGAVAIYGGHVAPLKTPAFCPAPPMPSPFG